MNSIVFHPVFDNLFTYDRIREHNQIELEDWIHYMKNKTRYRYKTKLSLESTYGKVNKDTKLSNLNGASQFTTLAARGNLSGDDRSNTMRSNIVRVVPSHGGETLLSQHVIRGPQQTLPHDRTDQMSEAQYENTPYRGNDRESVMYYVLENPPGYNDTQATNK